MYLAASLGLETNSKGVHVPSSLERQETNLLIATSKIAVTLDNCSKKWYNMSQGDEGKGFGILCGGDKRICILKKFYNG